ncbi:hypothetical protein DY000_02032879 [Brassica cretica]|uniref:Uncharacterized protein n=1 Tax=Brassica cretica TaxID=69181 RepID=A0ABQ7DPZ4_BRACR|nr:hypothetical protein DY000_02032879 [Brassica cretica]
MPGHLLILDCCERAFLWSDWMVGSLFFEDDFLVDACFLLNAALSSSISMKVIARWSASSRVSGLYFMSSSQNGDSCQRPFRSASVRPDPGFLNPTRPRPH